MEQGLSKKIYMVLIFPDLYSMIRSKIENQEKLL